MILHNLLLNVASAATEAIQTVTETVASTATEKSTNFPIVMGNAPFNERLMHGLKVAAVGILVVFLVLFILWAIITVMGLVIGKPKKADEAVKPAEVPSASGTDLEDASEEETVVALASAAIAAYEEKSSVDFEIVSVTPIEFTENK